MNKLKQKIIVSLAILSMLLGLAAPALPAHAAGIIDKGCNSSAKSSVCDNSGEQAIPLIKTVITLMFFLLGIIAVIMIIIGGFRYVTSNGDSGAIQTAKNTILYAVIGLIVAILSYAIVNFLVDQLG